MTSRKFSEEIAILQSIVLGGHRNQKRAAAISRRLPITHAKHVELYSTFLMFPVYRPSYRVFERGLTAFVVFFSFFFNFETSECRPALFRTAQLSFARRPTDADFAAGVEIVPSRAIRELS